jgi:hypothetical protein
VQHASESPQQSGFPEPWHPFQKYVATSQEADENAIDDLLLTDDDFADFLAHQIEMMGGELSWGLGTHDLILTVTGRMRLGVMYYNTRRHGVD